MRRIPRIILRIVAYLCLFSGPLGAVGVLVQMMTGLGPDIMRESFWHAATMIGTILIYGLVVGSIFFVRASIDERLEKLEAR